jgi:hypothetical protein
MFMSALDPAAAEAACLGPAGARAGPKDYCAFDFRLAGTWEMGAVKSNVWNLQKINIVFCNSQ